MFLLIPFLGLFQLFIYLLWSRSMFRDLVIGEFRPGALLCGVQREHCLDFFVPIIQSVVRVLPDNEQ